MTITMEMDRETKNTFRFTELTGKDDTPKIGVVYVPKATLKELGWKGQAIQIELKTA